MIIFPFVFVFISAMFYEWPALKLVPHHCRIKFGAILISLVHLPLIYTSSILTLYLNNLYLPMCFHFHVAYLFPAPQAELLEAGRRTCARAGAPQPHFQQYGDLARSAQRRQVSASSLLTLFIAVLAKATVCCIWLPIETGLFSMYLVCAAYDKV